MLNAIGDFDAPDDAAQFEAVAIGVRANPAFPTDFLEALVLGLGHRARPGMNPYRYTFVVGPFSALRSIGSKPMQKPPVGIAARLVDVQRQASNLIPSGSVFGRA